MNLGTNDLNILLCDSPREAPNYMLPKHKAANLKEAVIVGKGTQSGKATVDFIFEDESGQQYVAMLTGQIVRNLVGAINGVEARVSDG